MRNVSITILFMCVATAVGQQTLAQSARVKDHTQFFSKVVQETVYEIERLGFSSLKLIDITQRIDRKMYNLHLNGTVVYTNGFLVSIQKIDVTNMGQTLGSPTIDEVVTPRAIVSGILNLRDAKLGYDVIFTPVDGGPVQRYTGEFTHLSITWGISIIKNLTTKEISVTLRPDTNSRGVVLMVYRPANNVTEVLSREFSPSLNNNGVATWSTIIAPIILDVVKHKVEFPQVCYRQC